MKVVGIVCSPRRGGNTEILVREALDTIQGLGGETELITVAGKTIRPCDGCTTCDDAGECKIDDDMQEIYRKLTQADGMILGSPVYFANVTAQAKIVIDRTRALSRGRKLRRKVAAAVIVARRVGAGAVLGFLFTYFTSQRMIVAGGAIGYGDKKGDVREGVGGTANTSALEEARNLGRAVVSLHRQLSA